MVILHISRSRVCTMLHLCEMWCILTSITWENVGGYSFVRVKGHVCGKEGEHLDEASDDTNSQSHVMHFCSIMVHGLYVY